MFTDCYRYIIGQTQRKQECESTWIGLGLADMLSRTSKDLSTVTGGISHSKILSQTLPSQKPTNAPWQWLPGRLFSSTNQRFSGSVLVLQGVDTWIGRSSYCPVSCHLSPLVGSIEQKSSAQNPVQKTSSHSPLFQNLNHSQNKQVDPSLS